MRRLAPHDALEAIEAAARSAGLPLDAEILGAELRTRTVAWHTRTLGALALAPRAACSPGDARGLAGWTPVHVHTGDEPDIEWMLLEPRPGDSFFAQSVEAAAAHPFNRLFSRRTPLAELVQVSQARADVRPRGLIFHWSRCGSTVLARGVAALAGAQMFSEAQPLDAIVRLRSDMRYDDAKLLELMRAMVRALASDTPGPVALKCHAWHVLEAAFFARAFAGVPAIFVFREPRAILRSQARAAGVETIAGFLDERQIGVLASEAQACEPLEYTARVLGRIGEAALMANFSCYVDFAELPAALFERVLPAFGIAPSAAGRAAAESVMAGDTKAPDDRPYRPRERMSAGDEARIDGLATRYLDGVYERLKRAAAAR